MIGLADAPVRCSAAGCTAAADWTIAWRNPRLHTPERVKSWLACDEHREHLHGYLDSRGFPVLVARFGDVVERVPDRGED